MNGDGSGSAARMTRAGSQDDESMDSGTLFAADVADATWTCSKCEKEFKDGRT